MPNKNGSCDESWNVVRLDFPVTADWAGFRMVGIAVCNISWKAGAGALRERRLGEIAGGEFERLAMLEKIEVGLGSS